LVSISVRLSFWKETWLMFYNVWQLKALLLDSQREKLSKKLSEADQRNRFLKRRVCIHEKLGVFFMKAWCSLASKKSFLYMVCLWFACILVFLLMLLFYWRFSIIFLTKAVLGICVAVKLCKKNWRNKQRTWIPHHPRRFPCTFWCGMGEVGMQESSLIIFLRHFAD